MCLILNIFSSILIEIQKEKPQTEQTATGFYKCGRSQKYDIYCPILMRSENGAKAIRSTRQKKQTIGIRGNDSR